MAQQSPPLPWLEELGSQHLHEVDSLLSGGRGGPGLHDKLLREIDALHGLVQELRKRLNDCSPFLLLPREILREIVAIVASERPPIFTHCGEHTTDKDNSLGWISLTHVCRDLRAVAIGYHTLWANVVTVFPDAQNELLGRAGPLPLTLKNFQSIKQCEHAESRAQFMIQHLHLARHITLKQCCDDYLEAQSDLHSDDENEEDKEMVDQWPLDLAAFSRSTLLHLETLTLSFTLGTAHSEMVTSDVFYLPPMQTPRLRSVAFVNFYIPFHSGTLQSLDLRRTTDHALPTSRQFLDMLESCTGLKTLSLMGWVPPDLAPATEPHIDFSSLETITIIDRAARTASLRSHVILPLSTNRHFQFTGITQDAINTGAFLEIVQHRFHTECQYPNIYDLNVSQYLKNTDLIFGLKAKITSSDSEQRLYSQTSVDFTFRFSRATNQRSYFDLKRTFQRFIASFDLSQTIHLSLLFHGSGQYDSHQWCSMLTPLRSIKGLRLSGYAPAVVCRALAVSNSATLFPRLQKIWINRLTINGERADPSMQALTRSEFLQLFTSRKRDGTPIKLVRMDHILTDEVEAQQTLLLRLSALVPAVEYEPIEALRRQSIDFWSYFGAWPSIGPLLADV